MPDFVEHEREERVAPEPTVIVQPKLTVGAVDDPAEREADAVAAQVLRRLAAPAAPTPASRVQRAPLRVNRTADPVAASGAAFTPDPQVSRRIHRAMGGGTPLDAPTRTRFEGAMGADLGSVRVHTGGESGDLNQALGARAFTAGNHVFFGNGEYSPGTRSGDHLIAHELTHTVQQGAGRVRRAVIRRFAIDNPDFTRTRSVTVLDSGGSGRVAKFDDGKKPLIVKVDQAIGTEVVVSGNLHQAISQSTGKGGNKGKGGKYSSNVPASRFATTAEKTALATAAQKLIQQGTERNFLTGLQSNQPTIIMEMASGQDFAKVIAEGDHTKTKGDTIYGNDKSVLYQMLSDKAPLYVLGRHAAVDVLMGMYDRLVRSFNDENFMYDPKTKTFSFVDNTQNSVYGFLSTVQMGGAFGNGPGTTMTGKDSFDAWAGSGEVVQFLSGAGALAKAVYDEFVAGVSWTIQKKLKDPTTQKFWDTTAANQEQLMVGALTDGLTDGWADLSKMVLADPMKFVAGVTGPAQREALQSVIARGLVLQGNAPGKAWTAAGNITTRLLGPVQTWQSGQTGQRTGSTTPMLGHRPAQTGGRQTGGQQTRVRPRNPKRDGIRLDMNKRHAINLDDEEMSL